MNVLLVEPEKSNKYHTTYPPLGLLKLGAYHKLKGDNVLLKQGFLNSGFDPDVIYITSLFTYAYEPVHEAIKFYSERFKKAKIVVGGIYATLCSEHLRDTFNGRIEIYKGLFEEAEDVLPDYSLVPDWDASIIFASRGCIRKCSFCSVPILEPEYSARESIKNLVYPGHRRIIFWDNNILASPHIMNVLKELKELGLEVDFNQGLDARLIDEEIALSIRGLKTKVIRLAYDSIGVRESVIKSIRLLRDIGISGRKIVTYCLYNFRDSPEDFLKRIKDLLELGVVAYPMRYEPLEPRPKNTFVSTNWTAEQLEMVAKARRVLGYGGAFPPYDGLKKKILDAKDFESAFYLNPKK